MIRSLRSYVAKRKYHAQQCRYKRCSLYVFETHAIALPVVPARTIWPDDGVEDHIIGIRDFDVLGHAVRGALDLSPSLVGRTDFVSFDVETARFKANIERIRAMLDMGKERFNRNAELIDITEFQDTIVFDKQKPMQGYFAFDGGRVGLETRELPHAATATEIGRAIAQLL